MSSSTTLDFAHLDVSDEIGAIAVSRPTNPTGNVLTDAEVAHLRELAIQHGDSVYSRFRLRWAVPNIVFPETKNLWDNNTILCLSLSKLGLPGLRTGIIVAHEK